MVTHLHDHIVSGHVNSENGDDSVTHLNSHIDSVHDNLENAPRRVMWGFVDLGHAIVITLNSYP